MCVELHLRTGSIKAAGAHRTVRTVASEIDPCVPRSNRPRCMCVYVRKFLRVLHGEPPHTGQPTGARYHPARLDNAFAEGRKARSLREVRFVSG